MHDYDERLVPAEDRLPLVGVDKVTFAMINFDEPRLSDLDRQDFVCTLIEIDDHMGGFYLRFREDDLPGNSPAVVIDIGGDALRWLIERLSSKLEADQAGDD